MMLAYEDVVIRILASIALGAIIGFERELKDCPAGLRTHTLVCLGSAVFTIASLIISGPNVDVSRIAGQVVVGIGFIGGGVIFKSREHVVGLTTAASLWVAASLGLVIGMGEYFIGIVALAAAIIVLVVGTLVEKQLLHKKVKS